ncbi:Uncharacterized protein Adt_06768 [Abeliophyllum distichum]|uniref:Uncharacterized protein n=1 Tax=Abeliophyllum distichum TaxID=126358 RepID=A0ABD1V7W4_9LAMI
MEESKLVQTQGCEFQTNTDEDSLETTCRRELAVTCSCVEKRAETRNGAWGSLTRLRGRRTSGIQRLAVGLSSWTGGENNGPLQNGYPRWNPKKKTLNPNLCLC